jgi:hypothetical protein
MENKDESRRMRMRLTDSSQLAMSDVASGAVKGRNMPGPAWLELRVAIHGQSS